MGIKKVLNSILILRNKEAKLYIATDQARYSKGEHNMSIVIDGIIGAGKTTVGQIISDTFHIPFYEELKPSQETTLAQRMLDRFYEDQKRWSAIIQVMFLNERFKDIKTVQASGEQAIFDRSIYGDEVFARTIHERGQMSDDEFEIYIELLKNMLHHVEVPEILIYIDVSVDTALKRIKKRARSTEGNTIPRDYMMDLKRQYDMWYDAFDLCPKIRINLEASMFDDDDDFDAKLMSNIIDQVKLYIT
jgi:deoxyadenosine/deoxycytidine kinase